MKKKAVHKEESSNRIGILTFHCADNFGAILQAYGLLTWLTEQGFDAFIVNYVPPSLRGREWFFPYIPDRRYYRLALMNFKANIHTGADWWTRKRRMDQFRREYLTRGSRAVYSVRGLSRVRAGLLIVGSDQIWNPAVTLGFKPAYFGAVNNSRVKKTVAYAASFGTASLPSEAEPDFSRLLASVHNISMREKSAAEYIEARFQRRAYHVVDPVFLPDSSRWRAIADSPAEHNFILYYEVEYSEPLRRAAQQAAQKTGLKIIELSYRYFKGHRPFQTVYSAGPLQFLGYIDAAEYVFTNSFHALAFSILLHKPFYILNHSVNNARIESLLLCTGLTGRMAGNGCAPDMNRDIDWEEVDRRLEAECAQSKEFLHRSLSTQ